jgi:hypothetical protein
VDSVVVAVDLAVVRVDSVVDLAAANTTAKTTIKIPPPHLRSQA